jgi:hypothetical protein
LWGTHTPFWRRAGTKVAWVSKRSKQSLTEVKSNMLFSLTLIMQAKKVGASEAARLVEAPKLVKIPSPETHFRPAFVERPRKRHEQGRDYY